MLLHVRIMMILLLLGLVSTGINVGNSQAQPDSERENNLRTQPQEAQDLQVTVTILDKKSTTDRYTSFEMKKGNVTSKSHITYATRMHLTLKLNFTNVG